MGIHQALLGGYPTATPLPSWTIVGSDSTNGFTGSTVSIPNCQVGDQVWFAWVLDSGGSTAYQPAGYTQVEYNSFDNPDYGVSIKNITTAGTETVSVNSFIDNAAIVCIRSSTGSIVNQLNNNFIYSQNVLSNQMPTIGTVNFQNLTHPSNAFALCTGFIDDDNPVNLAAPSPYTFIVAGNVDDGLSSSAVFMASTVTTSSSNVPPGAGNAWTATAQNSDDNVCNVDYLFHGGT